MHATTIFYYFRRLRRSAACAADSIPLRHDINVQHCLNCQRRGRRAVPCRASMFAQCDDARQTMRVARNSDNKSDPDMLHDPDWCLLFRLRLPLLYSTALQSERHFIISFTTYCIFAFLRIFLPKYELISRNNFRKYATSVTPELKNSFFRVSGVYWINNSLSVNIHFISHKCSNRTQKNI